MINKMRCRQDGSISTHSHQQVNVLQVLSIKFHAIDATKRHIVLAKNGQQVRDALFVGLVALLEPFPAQSLGGVAAEF